LFPGEIAGYHPLVRNFISPDTTKITGEKKRVLIRDNKEAQFDADMIITISEVKDEVSYTAFFTIRGVSRES
jgi:uncharacterized protein YqfB (UPF0267 family)